MSIIILSEHDGVCEVCGEPLYIPCRSCEGKCGAWWPHIQLDSHDPFYAGMPVYGGYCRKIVDGTPVKRPKLVANSRGLLGLAPVPVTMPVLDDETRRLAEELFDRPRIVDTQGRPCG